MILSRVRQEDKYTIIKELHELKGYSIEKLCAAEEIKVSRGAYYKWLKRQKTSNDIYNEKLIEYIREEYEAKKGILGYRQMTVILERNYNEKVNEKRVLRLMRVLGLKAVIRRKKTKYIKSTPEMVAKNILNREFQAESCNEKWLTDVTEFKYGKGEKMYLSAIMDLGDRRIVSYVISDRNNNQLVFDTFNQAIELYTDARPLFHSDRGFQYTTQTFSKMLSDQGMTQSMSRVGKCIDNGPMEGFWGTLKCEMYYLDKFDDYENLKVAIEDYIDYYNNRRYQKRLKKMTPMEYHDYLKKKAA